MRKFGDLWILFSLILHLSLSTQAQDDSAKIEAIRRRATEMLTAAREKKWDDLYKFVVVVTGKRDKETRRRMGISENADEREIREKVGLWFKQLYTSPPPGNVYRVRLKEKDKTLALVEYRHEDLDGFEMVLVDGAWYYTLEY